jgi:putative methionine-R-sulfoxide reductase with GAF domain
MAVPLSREGELFAVLHVEREDASFSRSDLGIFSLFADQMMVALNSVDKNNDLERQLQALDDRTRKLDLLTRVTRSLTRKMSVDQLLEELLRLCAEAFELSNCALLLLDKDRSTLSVKASIGYSENAPRILAVGEGITGQVAASGVPILVNDVTKDSRYVTGVRDGRAEMAAPLRVFDEVIGVLDAESSDEGAFDEEDIDLFTSFAAQAAVVIHSMGIHTSPDISK